MVWFVNEIQFICIDNRYKGEDADRVCSVIVCSTGYTGRPTDEMGGEGSQSESCLYFFLIASGFAFSSISKISYGLWQRNDMLIDGFQQCCETYLNLKALRIRSTSSSR